MLVASIRLGREMTGFSNIFKSDFHGIACRRLMFGSKVKTSAAVLKALKYVFWHKTQK